MTASIAAGHVTFVRFAALRQLSGLAKRLWVYLEAERYRAQGAGQEATWIKLGDRAYTTLGMNYAEERFARAALRRAAAKVLAVDADSYVSIAVERAPHAGWRILAVRRTADGRRARQEVVKALARQRATRSNARVPSSAPAETAPRRVSLGVTRR
jgi:hypothetical protein